MHGVLSDVSSISVQATQQFVVLHRTSWCLRSYFAMHECEKDDVIAHIQENVRQLTDMLSAARSYVEHQQKVTKSMTIANCQINRQLELTTEQLATAEAVSAATKCRELQAGKQTP